MQSCEFSYIFFYPYSIDKLEDNQYCLDNEYLYHFSITSPITFTIFPYFFPNLYHYYIISHVPQAPKPTIILSKVYFYTIEGCLIIYEIDLKESESKGG